MANRIQTACCYVHKSAPVDVRLLHEHHRHPKGYGGADSAENLVWLCGSCHTVLHNLAHYVNSGKQGLASDLSMQYQTMQNLSPAGKLRLLELANIVAKAMKSYDVDGLEEPDDEDTVIMQLHVKRRVHKALKAEASKYTNPKSGRQMGLYNYANRVLENHIRVAVNTPMLRKDDSKFYGNEGIAELAAAELPEEGDAAEAPPVEPQRPQRRLKPIG